MAEECRLEGDPGQGRQVTPAVLVPATARHLRYPAADEIITGNLCTWLELVNGANSLKATGCLLAWAMVQCEVQEEFTESSRFFRSIFEQGCGSHGLRRARGAIFPMRAGRLQKLREVLQGMKLEEVRELSFCDQWAEDCWLFTCLTGLNGLSGLPEPLPTGGWSAVEGRAVQCMSEAVRRFLQPDIELAWTAEKLRADLKEKRLSYTGEEQAKLHKLTLEQVLPALPPVEHGGAIPLASLLSEGSRSLLENPEKLLLETKLEDLPKMQAKIHCDEADVIPLALELVRRGICGWCELKDVYRVHDQPVLSGLFGVEKPAKLPDGRPILRLIMNLIPSNSIMRTIQGRVRGLPSITSWLSIISGEDETLEISQSDMCSAFYLFSLPSSWEPYLCFNLIQSGQNIGKTSGKSYALCCKVLPMGWCSSVALMQEAAETLATLGGLDEQGKVARGQAVPSFMVDVLEQGSREGKPWWHCYLDNFCVAQKVKRGHQGTEGGETHRKAEASWKTSGIVEKKRVSAASSALELGACVDGDCQTIGISGERFGKLILAT